jgi:hypothetical protein
MVTSPVLALLLQAVYDQLVYLSFFHEIVLFGLFS